MAWVVKRKALVVVFFYKRKLKILGNKLTLKRIINSRKYVNTSLAARRFRGVETVLENGPPIGPHTFSSDLICQRMLPVPTFPPMTSTANQN